MKEINGIKTIEDYDKYLEGSRNTDAFILFRFDGFSVGEEKALPRVISTIGPELQFHRSTLIPGTSVETDKGEFEVKLNLFDRKGPLGLARHRFVLLKK